MLVSLHSFRFFCSNFRSLSWADLSRIEAACFLMLVYLLRLMSSLFLRPELLFLVVASQLHSSKIEFDFFTFSSCLPNYSESLKAFSNYYHVQLLHGLFSLIAVLFLVLLTGVDCYFTSARLPIIVLLDFSNLHFGLKSCSHFQVGPVLLRWIGCDFQLLLDSLKHSQSLKYQFSSGHFQADVAALQFRFASWEYRFHSFCTFEMTTVDFEATRFEVRKYFSITQHFLS